MNLETIQSKQSDRNQSSINQRTHNIPNNKLLKVIRTAPSSHLCSNHRFNMADHTDPGKTFRLCLAQEQLEFQEALAKAVSTI